MSYFSSDAVASVLDTALDGIALRQRVVANNIANVDTPGFHASRVDFETSLRAAIGDGTFTNPTTAATAEESVGASVSLTPTPLGPNQNSVDLQTETMTSMQTQFQYQIVSRAVSDRLALVKTAAGGF